MTKLVLSSAFRGKTCRNLVNVLLLPALRHTPHPTPHATPLHPTAPHHTPPLKPAKKRVVIAVCVCVCHLRPASETWSSEPETHVPNNGKAVHERCSSYVLLAMMRPFSLIASTRHMNEM